jgi:phosphate transport system protein
MIRFDNHAFKGLDEALRGVFTHLETMAKGAGDVLALMPLTLPEQDAARFGQAKQLDKQVNETEAAVDAAVADIIGKFSVVGEDLRFILAAVKVASTLERAADKSKNCVKRLTRVTAKPDAVILAELTRAKAAVAAMLPLAMAQLIDYVADNTTALLRHGAAAQQAYRTILLHLHAHQLPADDETHILLAAKNLEQIADMAVEIMKISHVVHFGTKYDKRATAAE